jgi:hypothetical protein
VTDLYARLWVLVVQRRGLTDSNISRYDGVATWDFGERWDTDTMGLVPTAEELQSVTPEEIAAVMTATRTTRYRATSRQHDVLATCALIVRARNITAWNAMTVAQKRDAALAEADVWVTIREWIEDHL